jgi:hypothetical protein
MRHPKGELVRKIDRPINNDAALRAIGVVALLAIGTIHFLQIVETFQSTPLLGLAYVALIVASVIIASWLLVEDTGRVWAAAGLLSLAVIIGYAFTRLASSPLDDQDVRNWACALGLASLFIEAALFGISTLAIAHASRSATSEPRIALADQREKATWGQGELAAFTVTNTASESRAITTRPPDPLSFLSDLNSVRHVAKSPPRRMH